MSSAKRVSLIVVTCSLAGIIFYGFYDEKIHIDYSIHSEKIHPANNCSKSLTFFYVKDDIKTTIIKTCSIKTLDNETLKNIVNIWLGCLFESDNKLQKTICHSFVSHNSLYYCSFTISPFTPATSLYEKYAFFEGLLQTLYDLDPSLSGVVFLIEHKTFEDDDYDFSLPWSYQLYK